MKRTIYPGVIILLVVCSSLFAQTQQTFTVTNSTGMAITSVFISPAGANTWSPNLSTKAKVLNNETFDFTQTIDKTSCTYDMKYIGEDGKENIVSKVDLCVVTTVVLPNPTEKNKTEKQDDMKKEK